MSISLTVGDTSPLSLSGLKDLAGAATDTNLKLGKEFSAYVKQPLSSLPPQFSSTGVQYTSGGGSWTPGMGVAPPLSFTLTGGVCGKVSVITCGNLLTYVDEFPQEV